MSKKKIKKRRQNKRANSGFRKFEKEVEQLEREVNVAGKDIEEEAEEVEKWVHERKKFFIKLGFVIGLVALLLIISHLYLRTSGVGI